MKEKIDVEYVTEHRKNYYSGNCWYRYFLCFVQVGDYIFAESDDMNWCQGGEIVKVIRDRYKIPVCFRVVAYDGKYDYITADRVRACEFIEPTEGYWDELWATNEELEQWASKYGYVYDDEECGYFDPNTGDRVYYTEESL